MRKFTLPPFIIAFCALLYHDLPESGELTPRIACGILPSQMTQDYLTRLLTTYWFAPPVALWRAVELRVAAKEQYEHPLLDLGCGDGLIAQVLFGTEGYVDVGFDPWAKQLCRAAQSSAYRHLDLADGRRLPYADGAFATIFSNSVLEHIPEVQPVLHEAGRVLKPDGRFICTVPSDAFRRLLDGYARRMAAGDAPGAEAYAAAVDEYPLRHREAADGVGVARLASAAASGLSSTLAPHRRTSPQPSLAVLLRDGCPTW
jgi:SAM-dependent methyltransferase